MSSLVPAGHEPDWKPTGAVRLPGGKWEYRAPTPLAEQWSEETGPAVCPTCNGMRFVIERREGLPPGDPRASEMRECPTCEPQSAGRRSELWRLSGLNPNAPNPRTLANFDPYDGAAQRMLTAAVEFAARPSGFLVYHGEARDRSMAGGLTGAGKSHLCEALARQFLNAGLDVLFMPAGELFQWLGAKYRSADDQIDYVANLEYARSIDVLIVDEFGSEPIQSDAVYQLRYKVIDARWHAATEGSGGATVLASNLHPDAWPDKRITSRCLDDSFTVIKATSLDYRRRGRQEVDASS